MKSLFNTVSEHCGRAMLALLVMLTLMMLTCNPAHAQGWTTDNATVKKSDNDAGISIKFQGVIDSTITTYTSNTFQLSGWQGESFYTYPVQYRYRFISAAGTPYINTFIQGNLGDTTWFTIDTLCLKDSAETLVTGTIDFNNRKCYSYRLLSSGATSGNGNKNRSDTSGEVTLYAPRRDRYN